MLCRFSVSNDLKYDAERDLKDIEASHIPVHALNKVEERSNAVLENQPTVAVRWICCRVQSSSHFCLCMAGSTGNSRQRAACCFLFSACSSHSGLFLFLCTLQSCSVSTELFPAGSTICLHTSAKFCRAQLLFLISEESYRGNSPCQTWLCYAPMG